MPTVYAPETKAQVIAEWKAGSSLNGLSKGHGIPKATIQRWVSLHPRIQVIPSTQPKKEQATYDLDAMALRLIEGSVTAVDRIYGVTSDELWLKRQNAADLAILAGVIADKLYRLLGAIQPAPAGEPNG